MVNVTLNRSTVKKLAKKFLTREQISFIREIYYSVVYPTNLTKLATSYKTDKWNKHWYAQHYQKHFEPLRKKKLNILEIGIGGYANPNKGGASLRMWRTYFPKSTIYGIDIHEKKAHEEKRIRTFQGSQTDVNFLKEVIKEIGQVDIIVDDGSHINEHVIKSFEILFPMLSKNGIYVIEDTQTSYWKKFGGSRYDLNSNKTIMEFFKNLCDGLNYAEFSSPDYIPKYFDKHIVSMHFYHNLIFIYKGENNEGSNMKDERLAKLISD
ncbi:conserved hypothetical protein [Hyella patelloides LEGE 07179]|uniref:Uncharacterized protein n=1 Tax=Hyella patelloides LEGE 07179 TaxID=945734 RepID=A0A563VN48_9CYAN|nr:class I SAM-dependent methyltransferase [Hyella patelloides]VEP12705.1 conserved hypothetical protein [Hyella patelloides LEGE 07179]